MPASVYSAATKVPGAALLRAAATVCSRGGAAGRLTTLIYHRVLAERDPLLAGLPDVDDFRWQVGALSRCFTLLPLGEAARRLASGTLPVRAACITFDDGYADNFTLALPVLREFSAPATFFVATGYLDGGRMFNDTVTEAVRRLPGEAFECELPGLAGERLPLESIDDRRHCVARILDAVKYLPPQERRERVEALAASVPEPLPADLMMTGAQVRELAAAGMEIGAHTVNHPILSRVPLEVARAEIADSREVLEQCIGAPVGLFAYPNGRPGRDYGSEHVEVVRALGFEAAVSTAWGVARRGVDRFQLPRFTPWDSSPERFVVRLLLNHMRPRPQLA